MNLGVRVWMGTTMTAVVTHCRGQGGVVGGCYVAYWDHPNRLLLCVPWGLLTESGGLVVVMGVGS